MAARKQSKTKKQTAGKSNKNKAVKAKRASSKPKARTRSGSKTVKSKSSPAKKTAVRKTAAKKKTSVSEKKAGRQRGSTFKAALKLYESSLKLMEKEKFDKAKETFKSLISQYPTESELLDRAHVLIQACDKRIGKPKRAPKLQGPDDYYDVGVAEMNRHDFDPALEHLEHALKLLPKADHILYALAAVSALRGERENALDYLERAIHQRDQNRFLAVYDVDFESLAEDADFIRVITPGEG